MTRVAWPVVLDRAVEIVDGYDTLVTLRQLFYRLVSEELLSNTIGNYKRLSARTAEGRRQGEFPDLLDRTREIHRPDTFESPGDAREWLRENYRRDRTEGQPVAVYLGVEKTGIVEQLIAWFGDLGFPIIALGGYSSQSYVDEVRDDVVRQGRPAVLVYAGDFDPSGEDIDRDFVKRTNVFSDVVRVALTRDQVVDYDLPPQPGKEKDSRAAGFVERHGTLVQVELDALPPDELRSLFEEAVAGLWDESLFDVSMAREREERDRL